MTSVRPAAVAGYFYPGSETELRASVEGYLAEAGSPGDGPGAKVVIAPHAGYQYSGPIAGAAFCELARDADEIRAIVLLGPAHRVPLQGLALPGCDGFRTPLGEVPVDRELARRAAELPQVVTSPEAHRDEHSLEVELPFLQVILGSFSLLPLVVGRATPEEVAEVLEAVWGGPETRVVISSDLSHYLPYDTAAAIDRETAAEILALRHPIAADRACGAAPVNGLLVAARRHALRPELLDLRNSGDTAGDRRRVVGYGAFAFREGGAA